MSPERMRFGDSVPAERTAKRGTPEALRNGADKVLGLLSKHFSVEGAENLAAVRKLQEEHPDEKFVIAASHLSNLDGPAAAKALGEDLDLQFAVSSNHFGITPQEVMYRSVGKENFTPLDYKKAKGGEQPAMFNPENFAALEEAMNGGKTPWIGVHPFTLKGEMQSVRVGPVYLAQRTGATIIPTALELRGGGSVSMEGPVELAKGIMKKAEAIYHVGAPIKLEHVDVSIIEDVLAKRGRHERPTREELEKFGDTVQALRRQAEEVASAVSGMLPESMRGEYKEQEQA